MKFEIFSKDELDIWQKEVESLKNNRKAINFLPQYYQSWICHEKADPYCIYAEDNGIKLFYPFFKKEINEFELDNQYFDIYTAYGYGGVITNSKEFLPLELTSEFNKLTDRWLKNENIVTEFIREMPAFNYHVRNANYEIVRTNVIVKCSDDYSIPCKNTSKSCQKALEKGLYIETDNNLETIEDFSKLYRKTAERIRFDDYYLFPNKYFEDVKTYLLDFSKIINIKTANHETIASMLVFHYAYKACLHLSASNLDYKETHMNDLLFKAVIEDACKNNIHYVCLGGGTSTKANDSLFRFKRKFGNMTSSVYVGKKVVNEVVYNQLIELWEERYPEVKDKFKNYFQRYRVNFKK